MDAEVDAAAALLDDPAAATVVAAERVTWPNGAIGCSDGEGGATDALEPGWRVVSATDDGDVHVHARSGTAPFVCSTPGAFLGPDGG